MLGSNSWKRLSPTSLPTSPSILISVPEYLPNRMRSPSFSARGNTLPSSLVLPLPTEMTSPSCGLSLAESGMMIPPRVVPTSSTRRTRMRSCSGVNFVGIFADSFPLNPVLLTGRYEDGWSSQGRRVLTRSKIAQSDQSHQDRDCHKYRRLVAADPEPKTALTSTRELHSG